MELWIRSQNKKRLTKVDSIEAYDNSVFVTINDKDQEIGRYKTSKRALEILEDIQKKLNGKSIVRTRMTLKNDDEQKIKDNYDIDIVIPPFLDYINTSDNFIYEMPEE